jgi:hypothetical protein
MHNLSLELSSTMKKVLFALTMVGSLALSGTAFAQDAAKPANRFGVGLSANFGPTPIPNAINARFQMGEKITLNGALGFRLQSGDFNEGTDFGLGGSAQYAVFSSDNLQFHVLGGLGLNFNTDTQETTTTITDPTTGAQSTVTTTQDTTNRDIALFGGFGAQYWFPGTRNFSMQVDVGPAIHLYGVDVETKTGNTSTSTDASAFALSLAENLSGGVLFTYWFGNE